MNSIGDKKFSRDFAKLTSHLTKKIGAATSIDAVREEFDMLKGLATHQNSPATAKTIYGLALLMDEKPWYDFKEGFDWVKKGADEAPDNEPFCWYALGALYLNGKPELTPDPISAKHWIAKAAEAGYSKAQMIMEIEWGDNPPGFKSWFNENYDRLERMRTRHIFIAITLVIIIIGIVVWLLLR